MSMDSNLAQKFKSWGPCIQLGDLRIIMNIIDYRFRGNYNKKLEYGKYLMIITNNCNDFIERELDINLKSNQDTEQKKDYKTIFLKYDTSTKDTSTKDTSTTYKSILLDAGLFDEKFENVSFTLNASLYELKKYVKIRRNKTNGNLEIVNAIDNKVLTDEQIIFKLSHEDKGQETIQTFTAIDRLSSDRYGYLYIVSIDIEIETEHTKEYLLDLINKNLINAYNFKKFLDFIKDKNEDTSTPSLFLLYVIMYSKIEDSVKYLIDINNKLKDKILDDNDLYKLYNTICENYNNIINNQEITINILRRSDDRLVVTSYIIKINELHEFIEKYTLNDHNYLNFFALINKLVKSIKTSSIGGKQKSLYKNNKVSKKTVVYQKKQSIYKDILGKQMKIYKIPDSRKEYVKYKGELHHITYYKNLMKQMKIAKTKIKK